MRTNKMKLFAEASEPKREIRVDYVLINFELQKFTERRSETVSCRAPRCREFPAEGDFRRRIR